MYLSKSVDSIYNTNRTHLSCNSPRRRLSSNRLSSAASLSCSRALTASDSCCGGGRSTAMRVPCKQQHTLISLSFPVSSIAKFSVCRAQTASTIPFASSPGRLRCSGFVEAEILWFSEGLSEHPCDL